MSRLFIICFARLTALLICNLHISHCQFVWWGRIIEGLIFVSTCFVDVFGLILAEYKKDSFFNGLELAALKGKKIEVCSDWQFYQICIAVYYLWSIFTSLNLLLLLPPSILILLQTSLYRGSIAKFYIVLPTFCFEMFKNNFRSLSLIELKALPLAI